MVTVATRRKCAGQKVDKWWPDGEGGPIYHAPGECYWQYKNCLTLDLSLLSTAVFYGIFHARASFVPRAILILLFTTFDTKNSEIIEVVAAAPETLRKIHRWRRCPSSRASIWPGSEKRIKLFSHETSWDSPTRGIWCFLATARLVIVTSDRSEI